MLVPDVSSSFVLEAVFASCHPLLPKILSSVPAFVESGEPSSEGASTSEDTGILRRHRPLRCGRAGARDDVDAPL